MSQLHETWDAVGADTLRERGSLKWCDAPGTLGAFIAEMDFGTAPAVETALHDVISRAGYGYLPQWLIEDLRTSFVNWAQARYSWSVEPERIQPIPDVLSALEYAIRHLTTPGTPVIVPTPAYMPFMTIPGNEGRELIESPMIMGPDGLTPDLQHIDAAFTAGAQMLILCNPHNPTGRVLSRPELEAIEAVVARHPGARVFVDEIHAPVVLPGASHIPYASLSPIAAAQAITATSTSKAFGLPGMKCAQLILSNDDDLAGWARRGERTLKLTSTVGVVANIAAYNEGGPWLDEMIDYLASERELLTALVAEHLPGVKVCAPQGTYIAWLDCTALNLGESPAAFFSREACVSVSDGAACGSGFEQHARLVFATPRPVLVEMIERMGAALAARG